MQQGGEKN